MKRTDPAPHRSDSRSTRMMDNDPHGRDIEKERRRREWQRQQEREREHERFKRQKIEEWERKRREEELKSDKGRSSYGSHSRSAGHSPSSHRKEEPQPSSVKPSVMSQKFESSSNSTRLFKGPEITKIDVAELRRIKVDIHRKIPAAEVTTELRREILDPEDVKLKRREGEGAKPIFEREELMASEVPASEVEERRTVVAVDNDRAERRPHTARRRSTSPTNSHKQHSHNSRRDGDTRSSRREDSKHNAQRSEGYRNKKHESEKTRSRDRSREHRERHKREDSRERRSPHRTSRYDVSRDHADRHNRSTSRNRDSRRNDTRRRSSRDRASHRENRDREDSRDRANRDLRSRERKMPIPHHYAEAMPVPVFYDNFQHRPIMMGQMIPMRPPMQMGRGGMPPMMGPMRPPYPARYIPPDMFRHTLHQNPRFRRMY